MSSENSEDSTFNDNEETETQIVKSFTEGEEKKIKEMIEKKEYTIMDFQHLVVVRTCGEENEAFVKKLTTEFGEIKEIVNVEKIAMIVNFSSVFVAKEIIRHQERICPEKINLFCVDFEKNVVGYYPYADQQSRFMEIMETVFFFLMMFFFKIVVGLKELFQKN